jgi:hypothetical protein
MSDRHLFWFPAKRYGFGWAAPVTWQGWAVLALYLVAEGICWEIWHSQQMRTWGIVSAVLTAAFMVVCYLTGEPLGWRWGR